MREKAKPTVQIDNDKVKNNTFDVKATLVKSNSTLANGVVMTYYCLLFGTTNNLKLKC